MSGKGIDNSPEQLSGNDGGYVIVVTRWNTAIVDGLLGGAMQALRSVGIADNQIRVVTVPGAFEIPLACKAAAARGDCDAVIALGAVIRGGTPHFEYVAGECTRGIGEVALNAGKPVASRLDKTATEGWQLEPVPWCLTRVPSCQSGTTY